MSISTSTVAIDAIAERIVTLRGQGVLLDSDLAVLYGVATKRFNEAVKRNIDRFPDDFSFQLNADEWSSLRSQSATSKIGRGGRRYLPFVFTEHGALMAATVLDSPRAVEVSIFVVRAFVELRRIIFDSDALGRRFDELERKLSTHDQAIAGILTAIRQMMNPPPSSKRRIGFT